MQTYTLIPKYSVLRDDGDTELQKYFKDAYALYLVRTHQLGNMAHHTDEKESDALKVMLDTLLIAKERIQKGKTIDTK